MYTYMYIGHFGQPAHVSRSNFTRWRYTHTTQAEHRAETHTHTNVSDITSTRAHTHREQISIQSGASFLWMCLEVNLCGLMRYLCHAEFFFGNPSYHTTCTTKAERRAEKHRQRRGASSGQNTKSGIEFFFFAPHSLSPLKLSANQRVSAKRGFPFLFFFCVRV